MRIRQICETRVRYGYRRVMQREGHAVNHKRTYRLYKEMGLRLRNKTPKRRVRAAQRHRQQTADIAIEWLIGGTADMSTKTPKFQF